MSRIEIDKIYKRRKSDRDIFAELMPFKIKEILLIANYYDAYMIEREGQFTDKVVGEYLQVNLYTAPRFTSAANAKEAMNLLQNRHFDLVIIMAGLDRSTPLTICRTIKENYPNLVQLLLVSNSSELKFYHTIEDQLLQYVERIFVWNGSTRIFLAMCKYIEDRMNILPDTKLGDTRVILLVENSTRYYSIYLPILFAEIMQQTQKLIESEPSTSDMSIVMKIRIRPKVILVSDYEHAVEIIDRYKDNLIGVISDVSYNREGKEDKNAGFNLIKYVKKTNDKIKCLLQSQDEENASIAQELGVEFINKNSPSLAHDIKSFIKRNLGFGDFIFRNEAGTEIDKAVSIEEFKHKVLSIPDDVLLYHTLRNDISTWLMARGEINLAKYFRRYDTQYFKSIDEMRAFINRVFKAGEMRKMRGRIINFSSELVHCNRYITRLGKGSLGGKGRGMAFLCNFIENTDLKKLLPNIQIVIPKSAIIGVDEYDNFIDHNNLSYLIYSNASYKEIKEAFLQADLTEGLKNKLVSYLQVMTRPLAVRSSGLFEDSQSQPFAGVYSTYLIPNNSEKIEKRLYDLESAIKLIYASIFTESSRAYFKAVDCMIEEEKMAVIIQEVVGNTYGERFYPNISGVAQSYNYYPFSYIKPEDGFAVIAIGLGAYVVGGEKTHRFCPRYPKLQLSSIHDSMRDTQKEFYAIDLSCTEYDLAKDGEHAAIKRFPLKEAESDGNLLHCASVYDFMNDRLSYDFDVLGPRIVDFANILQFDHIPLAHTLDTLLDIFSQAMGAPVEIEFAVNIRRDVPELSLLQIKPLIKHSDDISIDVTRLGEKNLILRATKGMGNGRITNIRDVIFVKPERFNKLKSTEIAKEVKHFNHIMGTEKRQYVLIGPGRWGTRDPLTGIPVQWSDISNAKIIVEQGLKEFPLEASLGSHFFHNVTSMEVGYFAVPFNTPNSFIDFHLLNHQTVIHETEYLKHIRFLEPLTILMDGKTQCSVIYE